jgi:hypothetical protein
LVECLTLYQQDMSLNPGWGQNLARKLQVKEPGVWSFKVQFFHHNDFFDV